MSSGSQETRAELHGELAREFRQFTGLGASFFRAAAEQLGLTVTDMQVMDLLESQRPQAESAGGMESALCLPLSS